MPFHDLNIKLNTQVNSFDDVNAELSSLKLVIGLIALKLTPDCREHLVRELTELGKPELAEMLSQFFPK